MTLYVDYASVDGNAAPDIAVARSFGIGGAIVRASYPYAGLMRTDPCVWRDLPAWRALGPSGAYHMLAWHVDPAEQINRKLWDSYTKVNGDLPPALDLEADSAASLGMTPAQCLEHAEECYDRMTGLYGTVMIYTSARVWEDVFGNAPSKMGAAPLWLKVPYPYKTGQPPHPETQGSDGPVPGPWSTPDSPGVWLKQFQGDARGVPGFTSTVDLSVFREYYANDNPDPRAAWVRARLDAAGVASVPDFQRARGLVADGVIGPRTFAALCG